MCGVARKKVFQIGTQEPGSRGPTRAGVSRSRKSAKFKTFLIFLAFLAPWRENGLYTAARKTILK
jgi:hypothetical protein